MFDLYIFSTSLQLSYRTLLLVCYRIKKLIKQVLNSLCTAILLINITHKDNAFLS